MPEFAMIDTLFFEKLLILCATLFLLTHISFRRKYLYSESAFVYYMFGIGVFVVTYCLQLVEMSFGFAFGLFAIFSMLRYRTEVMSFKEMTYLFLVIVLALLCAVSPLALTELVVVVALITAASLALESPVLAQRYARQSIRYEKIDNIRPENRPLLLEDLKQRTGLDIHEVSIDFIDFMQDSAQLSVVYRLANGEAMARNSTALSSRVEVSR